MIYLILQCHFKKIEILIPRTIVDLDYTMKIPDSGVSSSDPGIRLPVGKWVVSIHVEIRSPVNPSKIMI
jgi:hypothetical protein